MRSPNSTSPLMASSTSTTAGEVYSLYEGRYLGGEHLAKMMKEDPRNRTGAAGQSNGLRHSAFATLAAAVRKLATLPPGDELAISEETSKTSLDVLNLIAGRTVEAPKLMPFEGEALILTWDYGRIKRYLKINGDDIHLLDYQRAPSMRCEADWDFSDPADRLGWLKEVAGSPTSATAADFDF